MMIDATKILQTLLAHDLGLDRYSEIMHGDPASLGFQKAFNGSGKKPAVSAVFCNLINRKACFF